MIDGCLWKHLNVSNTQIRNTGTPVSSHAYVKNAETMLT